MTPWHRKRRYLGLLIVLCLYATAFLYDGIGYGSKPATEANATATDITCSRSWFHLGLVHDCTATIPYEGNTYVREFRHSIGPGDVGGEVAMTMTGKSPRTGVPRFSVARAHDGVPELVLVLSWLVLGAAVVVLLVRIFSVSRSRRTSR